MSEEQVRELLALFNSDSKHGKPRRDRFAPGFGGQIANALLTDLANFNHWTGRMWNGSDEERRTALGELLENRKLLPSAGTSYPTICPTGQVSGESGFAIAVAYSPDAFWNANGGDK